MHGDDAFGGYGDFYSDYYGLDEDELDRPKRRRRSHSSRPAWLARPLRRVEAIVPAAVAIVRDIARHPRRLVAPGVAAFVLVATLGIAVTAMPSGTGRDSGRTPTSVQLSDLPVGDGILNADTSSQTSVGSTPAAGHAGAPTTPGVSYGVPGQFVVDQPGGGANAAGPVTGNGTQGSVGAAGTSTTADNPGGAPSQSATAPAPGPSSTSQPAPQPTPTSASPTPPPSSSSSPAPSPTRSCSVVNPLPPYNCLVWAVS